MNQELPDEMFRHIVEAMPGAVVYSDRDGIIRNAASVAGSAG